MPTTQMEDAIYSTVGVKLDLMPMYATDAAHPLSGSVISLSKDSENVRQDLLLV